LRDLSVEILEREIIDAARDLLVYMRRSNGWDYAKVRKSNRHGPYTRLAKAVLAYDDSDGQLNLDFSGQ